MTDVDDPVRRLLKRIAAGENNAMGDAGGVSPDVARTWLALPEQLQQARDAMRWRKASRELPKGDYVLAFVGHEDVETVTVGSGIVVYGSGGCDTVDDLPVQARFLGPLPEVPR